MAKPPPSASASSAASSSPMRALAVDDGDRRRHGALRAHDRLELARDLEVAPARQPVRDQRALERHHRAPRGERAGDLRRDAKHVAHAAGILEPPAPGTVHSLSARLAGITLAARWARTTSPRSRQDQASRRETSFSPPDNSCCSRPPSRWPVIDDGSGRLGPIELFLALLALAVVGAVPVGQDGRRADRRRLHRDGARDGAPRARARGGDRGRRRARLVGRWRARRWPLVLQQCRRADHLPRGRRAAVRGARRPGAARRRSCGPPRDRLRRLPRAELPQLPADRRLPVPARPHEPARRDAPALPAGRSRGRSRRAR